MASSTANGKPVANGGEKRCSTGQEVGLLIWWTLDASTERIQIVDEDKNFTLVADMLGQLLRPPNRVHPYRQQLTQQISRWGLRDSGFAYNLVAVFGSQSTGKSTPPA
jgi:hypothetical protein